MTAFWNVQMTDEAEGIKGILQTPAIPVLNLPSHDPVFRIVKDSTNVDVLIAMDDEPITLKLRDRMETSEYAEFEGETPIRVI